MYKRMLVIALLTLLTLPFTANNWCQAGTTPPSLLSIDMSPASVDVSSAPADIAVTVHLTDNSSGVASWSITFFNPSGNLPNLTIDAANGRVAGTDTDGTFQGTGTLPQGSEEGAWVANILTVADEAGNSTDINLSSYGIFLIQVGSTLEDLTPPELVSIEVSPTMIDVTDADQQVTVTAHLTDDLSGVQPVVGKFVSPSGDLFVNYTLYLVSGTEQDGIFEATVTFPQYTEPGVWRHSLKCHDYYVDPPREYTCIYPGDRVGNYAYIDFDARGISLEVEVVSPPGDQTPPDLVSIEVSPTMIDVTDADQQVTVTAHLTDYLSGVFNVSGRFVSPLGNRLVIYNFNYPVSGTQQDGIFEATATFPQYTEPGVWRPRRCYDYMVNPRREYSCLWVADRVGNGAYIDLDAKGITLEVEVVSPVEDILTPELQSLSYSPTVIDISEGDAQVTVTAHMTDDLSGASWVAGNFVSPSGIRSIGYSLRLVSGTQQDGIFEATVTFPQYTEPGVWGPRRCYDYTVNPYREYSCLWVGDRVGNRESIDLDGSGVPLVLGVVSVPIELLFSLEPFSAVNEIESSHTLTATISQDAAAIQGAEVTFEIIQGPHQGASASSPTDANGQVTFSYTGTSTGLDTIIASVDTDGDGEIDAARQATKEWVEPSNQPPEALCKNVTVPTESGLCTASASIDAGSSDPDDGPITLAQTPNGPYGLGATNVTLTVTDDYGTSSMCSATVTVEDMTAPVPDVAALPEIRGECSASITTPPTATDACDSTITGTTTDPLEYTGPGTYTVTWTYTDNSGNTTTQTQTVVVEDMTPSVIQSFTVSPDTLWPPNHKMVPIGVSITASDNCDSDPVCKITSVSSNEPENGLGDGDTSPDWQITGDLTVNLRAERSGTGTGRVYTITVECADASNNTSTADATVTVPHNQ